MSCWNVLDIAPTQEQKDIKRAYTRQLRKHPPETDPQGFQVLRAAYEEARFLAGIGVVDAPPEDPAAGPEALGFDSASAAVPEPAPAGVGHRLEESPLAQAPAGAESPDLEEDFLRNLAALPILQALPEIRPEDQAAVDVVLSRLEKDFHVHDLRQSEAYWKELAESDLLWNLSAKAHLGLGLFRFLGAKYLEFRDHYTNVHVPRESWKLLDDTFGWLENEGELYARFPDNLVDAALDRVRAARGLAMSTDLPGLSHRAAPLLVDAGTDPAERKWTTWGYWVLGVVVVNTLFRCMS